MLAGRRPRAGLARLGLSEPADARRLRIGLTGGIGSGKSTVAAAAGRARRAAHRHRRDRARGSPLPGGAAIAAAGARPSAPTSSTPTARWTASACARWSSPTRSAKRRLEAHPASADRRRGRAPGRRRRRRRRWCSTCRCWSSRGRWRARVDRVLVVDCSEATQIERVHAALGLDARGGARASSRSRRRAPRAAPIADAVIYNDGTHARRAGSSTSSALWALWVAPDRPH